MQMSERPGNRLTAAIALTAALLGMLPGAQAADSAWVRSDYVEARLISATDATGDLAVVPLGLELRIKPGWKTYWRSPGDAGLPPKLDWAGSTNLKSADLAYPAPHRFELFGLQTFGYADHVVFPIAITPETQGRPLDLKAHAELLVCEQICVPQTVDLALSLPEGSASPSDEAQTIGKFSSQVPRKDGAAGLNITAARDVTVDGKRALEISARSVEPFTQPDVFAEVTPAVSLGAPQVTLNGDGKGAVILLPVAGELPAGTSLSGRDVTLTLVDSGRAVEQSMTVAAGGAVDRRAQLTQLGVMIGLALLGGLILNLMPCVLPVLSLKLMSVVSHGGEQPGRIRAGFLATASGILVSFGLIAVALILLRRGGQLVGWGIQFQEPGFIAFMAVVVTLFAANMAGLFEVPLPRALSGAGGGSGLAGDFTTGLFATLLATPCSAPFLGTAVGFALAGGAKHVLLIFGALGLGFASPYLLVAAFPRLAASLPKPGRWMLYLKWILAALLAATAVWLLTVLAEQIGMRMTLGVTALLLGLIAVLILSRFASGRLAAISGISAAVLAVAAVAAPATTTPEHAASLAAGGNVAWSPFDRNAIRGLVSQGKTVFVDVTADWCITCKANKQFVIERPPVAGRLGNGIVPMQADWTRPDPRITEFLSGHGRFGIPFNIVYGPGAPSGIVLPEILTEAIVLSALDRASAPAGQANAADRSERE